jgi:hypothetical protein
VARTLTGRADRSPTVLLAELPPGQLDSHPHDHHASPARFPLSRALLGLRASGLSPWFIRTRTQATTARGRNARGRDARTTTTK